HLSSSTTSSSTIRSAKVLSNTRSFVMDGIQYLGLGAHSLKRQFFEQSPLVDLLQEPATEHIGDLKHGFQYLPCQRIQSAFIGVHRRPIPSFFLCELDRKPPSKPSSLDTSSPISRIFSYCFQPTPVLEAEFRPSAPVS